MDRENQFVRLAVDLTPLSVGGPNGGIKPYLADTLAALGHAAPKPYELVILGSPSVREEFAPVVSPSSRFYTSDYVEPAEIASLADCLYCPLGHSRLLGSGLPTVSLIVDTLHRDHPEFLPAEQVTARENRFNEMVQHVDLFQCISTFAANRLVHHFDVSPDRIVLSSPVFQHGEAARADSAGRVRAPSFFYPANFGPHKNHETLLVAYRIYREANPVRPWPLVLMGNDDERCNYLRKVADLLGIGGGVEFVENASGDDLKEYYRSAGCLVFPSIYEGFGIPLLNAMEMGVPIVAGRRAAIPEVVGNAAHYTDVRNPQALASAMSRLASDAPLRERLVQKGRERCADGAFKQEIYRLSDAFSRAIAMKERRLA